MLGLVSTDVTIANEQREVLRIALVGDWQSGSVDVLVHRPKLERALRQRIGSIDVERWSTSATTVEPGALSLADIDDIELGRALDRVHVVLVGPGAVLRQVAAGGRAQAGLDQIHARLTGRVLWFGIRSVWMGLPGSSTMPADMMHRWRSAAATMVTHDAPTIDALGALAPIQLVAAPGLDDTIQLSLVAARRTVLVQLGIVPRRPYLFAQVDEASHLGWSAWARTCAEAGRLVRAGADFDVVVHSPGRQRADELSTSLGVTPIVLPVGMSAVDLLAVAGGASVVFADDPVFDAARRSAPAPDRAALNVAYDALAARVLDAAATGGGPTPSALLAGVVAQLDRVRAALDDQTERYRREQIRLALALEAQQRAIEAGR